MILARLGHSIRSHDWFTALIELVLLVMGIFSVLSLTVGMTSAWTVLQPMKTGCS
jgi:hypothetical protein